MSSACKAAPRQDDQGDDRWNSLHHLFANEAKDSEPEILWLGDDIVHHLVNSNVWEKNFCQMHSLSFAIEGERTENLIWRLEDGELKGVKPKVIVLHIGTSNYGHSQEEIAEGIKTICSLIRDKQPQAYLLVLTLLPRGRHPNPLREKNAKVNDLIREHLKSNSRVQVVNIDPGFVLSDGTISHHDMFDYLHLTQKGYDRAFEPVVELLQQIMGEFEEDIVRTEAEGAAS